MTEQLRLDIKDGQTRLEAAARLWEEALTRKEPRVGRQAVESWLRPARLLEVREEAVSLGVDNGTAREWIGKKYARDLEAVLSELQQGEVRIEVQVTPQPTPRPKASVAATAAREPRPATHPLFRSLPLQERYTFESFVVGQSNRLAHASAIRVAEAPGEAFNPIFFYGGYGVGKTTSCTPSATGCCATTPGPGSSISAARPSPPTSSPPCASPSRPSSAATIGAWTSGWWTTCSSSPTRRPPRRSSSTPSTSST